MTPVPKPAVEPGLVGALKQKVSSFNFDSWSKDIAGSSSHIFQIGIAFAAGFSLGFLFKKYFKSAFIAVAASVLVLAILHHSGAVTIQWPVVKQQVGVSSPEHVQSLLAGVVAWARTHVVLCLSAVGGCFIGYKLG